MYDLINSLVSEGERLKGLCVPLVADGVIGVLPSTDKGGDFLAWRRRCIAFMGSKLDCADVYVNDFEKSVGQYYPLSLENGIVILKSMLSDLENGYINEKVSLKDLVSHVAQSKDKESKSKMTELLNNSSVGSFLGGGAVSALMKILG